MDPLRNLSAPNEQAQHADIRTVDGADAVDSTQLLSAQTSGDGGPATHPLAALPSFPHPTLTLPLPQLTLDFRMSVTLNPLIPIGATPSGVRNWVSFTGGTWSGTFGSGTVVPGGQDLQTTTPTTLTTELSTQYLLLTSDTPPAPILARTSGFRTGPRDVLEALADPERAGGVDPSAYCFRLFVRLETGDARYAGRVNGGMWVGSGVRRGAEVVYDAYRIQ